MNFNSFMPDTYKEGLIKTLLHRAFLLCFNRQYFNEEVKYLKIIFQKNKFPEKFVDRCIKEFLNKIFRVKQDNFDVPKRVISICIPFLGADSFRIRKSLLKFKSSFFPQCNLKIIFKSFDRLRSSFLFKDNRYTCSRCNSVYLGKTL